MDNNMEGKAPAKEPAAGGKILLVLLPYWDPLIPPAGIAGLSGYLKKYGYRVKTVDANVHEEFQTINHRYFKTLMSVVPPEKRGNFFNVGKNVLHNHMMAHIHHEKEEEYHEAVKILIRETFFHEIGKKEVELLTAIVAEFYGELETYIVNVLLEEQPGVLGISVFKGTAAASWYVARKAREMFPCIKIVMGGGIFTDQLAPGSPDWPGFLDRNPYIDAYIAGEGEILFLKYLRGELPAGKKIYTLQEIQMQVVDLETIEEPDYSGFQHQYYPMLGVYLSRSCPYQCTFCSEARQWGKYRRKRPARVVEELQKLSETYHYSLFLMTDSLLNPVIDEFSTEMLKAGHRRRYYWDGYLRVDKHVCRRENPLKWREAGFYRARLGVESGSERILHAMDKKITPTQIKESLKNLARAGIKTTTYWIVGYPGETEDDFRQTLALIDDMKDEIYEAEFNPFWYYPEGQVNSPGWNKRSRLLYPESAAKMFIFRTWVLEGEPTRKETYERLSRVSHLCKERGIPNPYSLYDIYQADERWQKLHPDAVPSLNALRNSGIGWHTRQFGEPLGKAGDKR